MRVRLERRVQLEKRDELYFAVLVDVGGRVVEKHRCASLKEILQALLPPEERQHIALRNDRIAVGASFGTSRTIAVGSCTIFRTRLFNCYYFVTGTHYLSKLCKQYDQLHSSSDFMFHIICVASPSNQTENRLA